VTLQGTVCTMARLFPSHPIPVVDMALPAHPQPVIIIPVHVACLARCLKPLFPSYSPETG